MKNGGQPASEADEAGVLCSGFSLLCCEDGRVRQGAAGIAVQKADYRAGHDL
jgi:hypothetical protein